MERIEALVILGLDGSAEDAQINAAFHAKSAAIQTAYSQTIKQPKYLSDDAMQRRLAIKFYRLLQQLENVYLSLGADASAQLPRADVELDIPVIPAGFETRKLLLPAAAFAAAAGIGGLVATGALDSVLNLFTDLDQEVLAQQRIEARELIDEIQALKAHLEVSIQQLEASVSSADSQGQEASQGNDADVTVGGEKSKSAGAVEIKSSSDSFWNDFAQQQIVQNTDYQNLDERKQAAESLLVDDYQVGEALGELKIIKDGYGDYQLCFDQLSVLGRQTVALDKAREQWRAFNAGDIAIQQAELLAQQQKDHLDNRTACENMQFLPQALAYYHDANQQTEPLLALINKSKRAKRSWAGFKKEYELDDPQGVVEANKAEKAGQSAFKQGLLDEATRSYEQVLISYSKARKQVAGQVAAIIQARKDAQSAMNADALAAAAAAKKAALARAKKRKVVEDYTGKLVSIPAGTFRMGDLAGAGDPDELPIHRVEIKKFTMVEHEVTFAQWDACYKDGRCIRPDDEGWGRGNRPVIHVSWNDVEVYLEWLNEKTGKDFRLASEAEWEYVARVGAETKYTWGDSINCKQARFDYYSDRCVKTKATDPVKTYQANAFGLYDIHGNVWEMTADCWNHNYKGAPKDGSSWAAGDCARRVLRGGSWNNTPFELTSANRNWSAIDYRFNSYGFRLAHDGWFDFVEKRKAR